MPYAWNSTAPECCPTRACAQDLRTPHAIHLSSFHHDDMTIEREKTFILWAGVEHRAGGAFDESTLESTAVAE
jgi:hypothetical protein